MILSWNEKVIGPNNYEIIVRCEKCNKKYGQFQEILGAYLSHIKSVSEKDICPYCGHINRESKNIKFSNHKLESIQ